MTSYPAKERKDDNKMNRTLLYMVFAKFGAILKIHKKSKFDQNQLKLSTQHKNMYMY